MYRTLVDPTARLLFPVSRIYQTWTILYAPPSYQNKCIDIVKKEQERV